MENNTKHTPLPWNLHPDYKGELIAVGGGDVPFVAATLVIAQGKKIIGKVELSTGRGGYPHVESEEELRANADLIVRAVNSHADLLAALRDITDLAERYGVGEHCDGNILAARAAIAKAEGGSQ